MSKSVSMRRFPRFIWWVFSTFLTVLLAILLANLLEDKPEITFAKTDDILVSVGPTTLFKELTMEIEQLSFKGSTYGSIRIIRYTFENISPESINQPSTFYFLSDGNTNIDLSSEDAIVGVAWDDSRMTTSSLIKRVFDPKFGTGISIISSFPGKSSLNVTLFIDISKYPALEDEDIKIVPEAGFVVKEKVVPRTYALTLPTMLLIVLISAAFWASLWMIINVKQGTYTAGSRIINRILYKLGLPTFIPKDEL
ncbi:hypothetical protein ACFLWR_00540 [Chloroflexota bacterium]